MAEFKITTLSNGKEGYKIRANQKSKLEAFLRQKTAPTSSKAGIVTQAEIDGVPQIFKNKGPTGSNKFRFEPTSLQKNIDKARVEADKIQTVGPNTMPDPVQLPLSRVKLQAHHKRMLKLYAPLYKGLSETDALELSRYFAEDLGMPLGSVAENTELVPGSPHSKHHDFIDESTGRLKDLPDFDKPRFVDGKELKGLELKKYHAKNFYADLLQPAIDDDLIQKTADFANQNPKAWKEMREFTPNHVWRDMVESKAGKALSRVSGKLSKADLIAQTATGVATGNVIQAGAAGTTLAASQALQHPAVQKRIAKQTAELIAKRGAKSAAKLIPGLDIAMSGMEAWGYLSQGRLDQAGIAALSGAIGWIPVIGDGAAAALDLSNTGIDIARLNLNQSPDIDMTEGGKVSKYESGVMHSPTGQGDEAFDNVVNALKENPNRFDSSGFGNRMNIDDIGKALSRL